MTLSEADYPRSSHHAPVEDHVTRLSWGGWIRTTNFPGNSRAVCQLTYTPGDRLNRANNLPYTMAGPAATRDHRR